MKFKTILIYGAISTLFLSGCGVLSEKNEETTKPSQSKQTEVSPQKSTTDATVSDETTNSGVDSKDPVYEAMMDPNTELGKVYKQILDSEKQLNEDNKRRVEQVKQNLIDIAKEKQQLQEELKVAEQELSTLTDEKEKAWKKEEINLLTQKITNKDNEVLDQKELLNSFLN